MPEIIHCPRCERQLRVPEELLGKQVQCPSCSATFTAAGGEVPLSVQPAAEEPPDRGPRRRFEEREDYADDDYDRPRRGPRGSYGFAPHRGAMILTFGIMSIVFGCFGLVFGPMAWAMGNNDMAAMRTGRVDPEGEALTNAGRICGIIGTILGCLGLCWGLLWFVFILSHIPRG